MPARIVAALLALMLAATAGVARAGETLDAIRARGELRVGSTGDYKPFTFRKPDGSFYGADIEMAKRLADRMGVRLVIVPTVWGTLSDQFKAREFDIAMGGVTVLPPRAALGDFSTVTYVDGKRPVARCADRDRYTSIEAINQPDVRVVVNPGAANEAFARANFPRAQLTVHTDNATVFDEIAAGRADVMVTDGIEVDHMGIVNPALCPTRVAAPFTRLEKAYWMQRDPELLVLVDAWLKDEMGNGSWTRILDTAQHQP